MKKTQLRLAAFLLLTGLGGISFAQTEPFALTEAPFGSPAMDGDIADWMAMRNDTNVLNMSYAHGERNGAQIGEAFEVNIQYAWDDTNFYFLVEEVSDDDPSLLVNDVEWCVGCVGSTTGGSPNGPAPWNTDSVGFYDKGITWPGNGMPNEDIFPNETTLLERGPYTQFWVALPTEEEIVIDDVPQNYHMTRIVNSGIAESGDMLIGNGSQLNETVIQLIPDLPALTAVQSAHGIVDDGANGGRGRRFTEAFMRWDQIRYPDPEKNDLGDPDELDEDGNLVNPVAARIRDINDPEDFNLALDTLKGHYVEDIGEGYEFRLEPLLVDGLSGDDDPPYPFGGQTHPVGLQDPQNHQEWDEIAVIRLVEGNVSLAGDCDSSGSLDAGDLSCVTTLSDRDAVLGALNTIPGDLDGVDGVAFADFLKLSGNFGNESGSYADGNIDLEGVSTLLTSWSSPETSARQLRVRQVLSLSLLELLYSALVHCSWDEFGDDVLSPSSFSKLQG